MCGIAGQLRFPTPDVDAVRRMIRALRHRGPDDEGLYVDGPVALAHRRLSIIDLDRGAQPMFNEDRSVTVVLNGEIYNYRELAAELHGRHVLATASDTEVLVHLYEDFGVDMLSRLRGMFAFALWDARRQRLFAARDPIGKKPLLYVSEPASFWFASELGALRQGGAPVGDVDPGALSDYLALLYVPAPRTIWTKARKLPAAHYLLAGADGVTLRSYWSTPRPGSVRLAPPTAVARTRALLEESSRLRLRADVPVGVLLSGGIDSSVVTALAARASARPLQTFTVGFGDADDELPLARAVARQYGTDHHELVLDSDVVGATTRALDAFSEPFGDSSAVPCAEVFRLVRRHVKVVLTGDGGDELFAGYGRYRQVALMPYLPFTGWLDAPLAALPLSLRLQRARRALRACGSRRDDRGRVLMEVFPSLERGRLLGTHGGRASALQPRASGRSAPDAAIAFDLDVYLPDDLLVKTDITSMASGLEARCPLLDLQLAEWVVPLPIGVKQDRRRGKLLLQAAVADLLPTSVFQHPKRGFGSPVERWLKGPLRELLADSLLDARARVNDWLDRRGVVAAATAALNGRGNPHQAWALLALEHWARSTARQ